MIKTLPMVAALAALPLATHAQPAGFVAINGLTCTITNGAPKVQGMAMNLTGTPQPTYMKIVVTFINASNVPVSDSETWAGNATLAPGQSASFWTVGQPNTAVAMAAVTGALDANNDPIPTNGPTVPCS